MNIQLGICQWSIPAEGAEKQLALAAQVALAGVEPDLGSYEQDFPLSHKDMQSQYKTWREQFGLVYPALAVNALCNYGMSQSASHPVANLAIAKAVETAVVLDIPIVQLPSFVKGDILSEEDFQNTLVCLRHACDCAAGTDLIIGSENALSAEKQLEMIEVINAENFRIYFDTRNLFAMKGYDSVSILEVMMPHICEVHIKDGVDGGPSTLLGQGNSGFYDSMQVLKAHTYTGWLLLENSYGEMAKATEMTAEALLKKDIQIARDSL